MPDESGNYNLKCVSPINVILRKQWIENERLAYPIIQIPLEMTDLRSGFFRNRMMWIGFTIAGAISLLNGLNFLYPSVPRIPNKRAKLRPRRLLQRRIVECYRYAASAILSVSDLVSRS